MSGGNTWWGFYTCGLNVCNAWLKNAYRLEVVDLEYILQPLIKSSSQHCKMGLACRQNSYFRTVNKVTGI